MTRLTIYETVEEVGVFNRSYEVIVTKNLGMIYVSNKIILQLLTQE